MDMTKNKKPIAIPLLSLALVGLAVGAWPTSRTELYTGGQIVLGTPEELAREADTILIGMVEDIRTELWPRGAERLHPLVKIVKASVVEYIKNPLADRIIEVRLNGEGYADIPGVGRGVKITPPPWEADFKVGEKVLLFLDFDEGNVLGDGYYTVGGFQGKYSIVGDLAVNRDTSRNMQLSELLQIIKNALQKG
jgi:hypothetical protein